MDFVLIEEKLNPKGLSNPTLEVLNLDANLYNALLFQPVGKIECSNQCIRNADKKLAKKKFNAFFDIAIENNVELAVTPEYSCPWSVIEKLIDENRLPRESKLWIVGCESIQAQQLSDIINDHDEIVWICNEGKIRQNLNNDRFFNPVCYLFKTRTLSTNKLRTIAIVQFKTHFMGGNNSWERDNYIEGQNIYILKNQNTSSRLLTFICSDTLNHNLNIQDQQDFAIDPYLIVHIQLNREPFHADFGSYRCDIFSKKQDNKEILCLNWGRNIQMNDTPNWNNYGGSAIFTKSTKLDLIDEKINTNHDKGLYYTRWEEKKSNIYFLNFDEYIFCIRNTKPSQAEAHGSMPGRTGPEPLFIKSWDYTSHMWIEKSDVNDGFIELCQSIEGVGDFNTLINGELSHVNIERLIALSVGEAVEKEWYLVSNNKFFITDDRGSNKRITFAQDPCLDTNGIRRRNLIRYATLANHIIEQEDFPDVIAKLKGNCRISYCPNENIATSYNLNLFSNDDEIPPATVVYKGEDDINGANETYEKIANLFPESQNWARIVVWYRDAVGYKNVTGRKPKIADNSSQSFNSINTVRK